MFLLHFEKCVRASEQNTEFSFQPNSVVSEKTRDESREVITNTRSDDFRQNIPPAPSFLAAQHKSERYLCDCIVRERIWPMTVLHECSSQFTNRTVTTK